VKRGEAGCFPYIPDFGINTAPAGAALWPGSPSR
jgi:hypothetical protein